MITPAENPEFSEGILLFSDGIFLFSEGMLLFAKGILLSVDGILLFSGKILLFSDGILRFLTAVIEKSVYQHSLSTYIPSIFYLLRKYSAYPFHRQISAKYL